VSQSPENENQAGRSGQPSASGQPNTGGQPRTNGQPARYGQSRTSGRAGGAGQPRRASDPVVDFQRWLMRAGARSMANQVADQVRRTINQERRSSGNVWDTATNELPPEESPECQWCPVCQAARAARLSGPGLTSRLADAGGALASMAQDAFSAFDQIMKTQDLNRAARPPQNRPASPAATAGPGNTPVPGNTPAPGNTSVPGSPSVPGNTPAPGSPPVPGHTPAPGSPPVPGGPGGFEAGPPGGAGAGEGTVPPEPTP
jgi:hypothetical protein